MDKRLRPIFSRLYWSFLSEKDNPDLFAPTNSPSDFAAFLAQELEHLQLERSDARVHVLREDAKYFLLTAFTQMVYMPFALAAKSTGPRAFPPVDPDRVRADVAADLKTIVEAAGAKATGPINTHDLIDILPTVWEQLRTGVLWQNVARPL